MLLVWVLALIVFRPAALDADALRASMTRSLAIWSGGRIAIGGPIDITYFPTVSVQAQGVTVSTPGNIPLVDEIKVEKLRIEAGLLSLLWPNSDFEKLVLEGADIALRAPDAAHDLAQPKKDEFRLLQAMKDSPVEWLILRGSRMRFAGHEKETLDKIDADIRLTAGTGAASASGRMNWRERPVTFSANGGPPQIDKGSAAIPVTMKLEAPAVTAALDGRAAVASGMQFAGQIDLNISDIVKFGRWMGLLLPEGGDARHFTVAGKFDWDKELIGFDEGSFSIDGNRAIGALSLKLGAARPQVEGTLAFQKLALPALRIEPAKASPPSGGPDSFTWMHHVDMDLRISTASLVSPSLEIGQAAISAVLRAGQLDGDFAILDLCEGRANGRFEYNAGVPEGRARLVSSVGSLSAGACLAALTGASPLRGATDIEADVTSQGRDLATLMRKAAGQVKLRLAEGEIDLDVAKLTSLAANGEVSGWEPLRGRTTAVSAIEGTILLRPGIAYSDSIMMTTADKVEITGEGSIDLATWNVDYRLTVANGAPATAPAAGTAEPQAPARLVVSGSVSKPVFQAAPVRSGSPEPGGTPRYAAQRD